MRTFVELVERYVDPELCPYPEYKGKPYYSIKYIENGEEHVGYSSYSLQVMSGFLKKYFMSPAMEKQEQINTQSVNLTHTTYPNALESLKILESAKDENGCVPMSLVRLAFRNVLEQDRKEAYEKGLSDAWDAARKIGSELRYGLEIMGFSFEPRAVGYDPGWYVVQRHSASECIAKIRQYELFRDGRISSEDAR